MKVWRNLFLSGGILALSACTAWESNTEIEALNEAQAVGSPFTQTLADEYRVFANREMNEMFDYPDALHFARKGLTAASGETVLPEPPTDWNLTPEHAAELGEARGRLMNALSAGGREASPADAAHAQVSFDCWMEQQEENWQTESINECKNDFRQAMVKLEEMLRPEPEEEEVEPAPDIMAQPVEPVGEAEPLPPMKPEDAMYLVFFDFDSYKLNKESKTVLDAVADEAGKLTLDVIKVIGHTDSSGPNDYNNRLAMKRANAVRDMLIGYGVSADLISVEGRGEDELLIQTDDNVKEPANRRVEITFGAKIDDMS